MSFCIFCKKEFVSDKGRKSHEHWCSFNPEKISHDKNTFLINRKSSNQFLKAKELGLIFEIKEETREKLSIAGKNQKRIFTEDTKNSISLGMKKAHEEGRAHNIGQSRWNNEMSYPEKFFKAVIENEFSDKNFIQEFNVGIYSIDFAWVEKKLAIEIDGEQHEKEEYKERDKRKDKKLLEEGWKVLRIKWKDLYSNTKEKIEEAKTFINN